MDSINPNYTIIGKKYITEINSEVIHLEHIKSGAQILKINNSDTNKTFSITFKTEPDSDCGTPHILEHSVLNGSKNFPVKSPFDELSKGSLKTFLNAMTGADYTMYPVASMSETDYFNLMTVYLDAVFFPNIYSNPLIFKQEGWHYELNTVNDPLIYKGVVYNEMKGAFSNPMRELNYLVYKALFPDNGYGKSSGGYPDKIPELSEHDFLNFHRKFYHPSNSYIVLYGNAPLQAELHLLNNNYLSVFEKSNIDYRIKLQKPLTIPANIEAFYPVTENSETGSKNIINYSWVIDKNADYVLMLALDLIADIVFNQESAPLRLAMQNAGIGTDISASATNWQQNVFSVTIQNATRDNTPLFNEVLFSELQRICNQTIDKQKIEASLNRMEFNLRDTNDAQKGLTYTYQSVMFWMHGLSPYFGLEWEKPLQQLKNELSNGLLEQIIKSHFLLNNHAVQATLIPKPGLENEKIQITALKLAQYKSELSPQEIEQLNTDTAELITFQREEESSEKLSVIPVLKLSDINPSAHWYPIYETKYNNTKLLIYNDFTNKIIYTSFIFRLDNVPDNLLKYASLLCALLGKTDTQNYTFTQLETELKTHTGGFSCDLSHWLVDNNDNKLTTACIVMIKNTNSKTNKAFHLVTDILNNTHFENSNRLQSLLMRLYSQLERNIQNNGMYYALNRLQSYFSNSGVFTEQTSYFDYYIFIKNLAKNFDQLSHQIIANLQKTYRLIFTNNNLTIHTTLHHSDQTLFNNEISEFIPNLNQQSEANNKSGFKLFQHQIKNEAILSASKVQFVTKGFNYKQLGFTWNAKLTVLSKLIASEWLHQQIRVLGGAYGAFCNISQSGTFYLASYRDPNLSETLKIMDKTAAYISKISMDEKTLHKFIIGTIANIDRPLTPVQKGAVALNRYLTGKTPEQVQNDRTDILATKVQDLTQFSEMITAILSQQTICVYGNEQKLIDNKHLFGNLLKLE